MEDSQPATQQPVGAAAVQSENSLIKDLLIPISIVLAGIAIGVGLYFSGGPAQPQAVNPSGAPAAASADNTGLVNEVTDQDNVKGNLNGDIKIVEFSDFDCVFCARFHDTMNEIVAENTDVAWAYRHFPIEQLHPQATAVAVASECVAKIGGNDAFWIFADGYFAAKSAGAQVALDVLVPELVAAAGVESGVFASCFENGETLAQVQEDVDNATATGGRGTPWSILIGPSGKTYPINGALPKQAVEQLIELARQEA